jgi:hypothetical protein
VKGGKTRKYKGGESLRGKSVTITIFVTEKDGVLLGDPKVSTIRTLTNPVPKGATPLKNINIQTEIQSYIAEKMKDYDLDILSAVVANGNSSKQSIISNMKTAISSSTQPKVVSDEELFNKAKASLDKKIAELTSANDKFGSFLSVFNNNVFIQDNRQKELILDNKNSIVDLSTDATQKLTNFNTNINSIHKLQFRIGIKIGQTEIKKQDLGPDDIVLFLQALFKDPRDFTASKLGLDKSTTP